jgi:hypothetical protein
MTERTLEKYFNGTATAEQLAEDLKNTQEMASYDLTNYYIEDIKDDGEYELTPEHLVKLCDDTLNGKLQLKDLNSIAFALNFSDYFTWDGHTVEGERMSNAIFAWDNPEIDYPLTIDNIQLWRHFLLTGEDNFNPEELKRRGKRRQPNKRYA